MRYVIVLILLSLVVVSRPARGEAFSLQTIESSQVDPILTSLAAAFVFRPTEGASALGSKWGGYIAAGASGTSTALITSSIAGTSNSMIPNGELQFGVGLGAFTIEAGYLPSFNYSGTSISKTAGALKWTLNNMKRFKKLPISLAARGLFSSSSISYSQTAGGGTVAVEFSSTVLGAQLAASRYLGFTFFGMEPYIGLGFLNQSSSIGATGTASLFGSSIPAGTTSISSSGLGLWYQAGLMFKLGIFGLTAQYDSLFGISSYAGKLSMRF